MGGHAFVHKRAEHFLFPADKLIVVGHDTKHVSGEHPLWRADCNRVPDDVFVANIRKHGIIQPIRARKLPKSDIHDSYTDCAADDFAEVVVGRERVKAARILAAEGQKILVPTLLWPAGTPLAEIIGAANAENYQRKTESLIAQAEHVYMQLRAEGFFDGADEAASLRNVTVSTGFNAQRIRNLLAFREDQSLVRAVNDGQLRGEAALAIATITDEAARAEELARVLEDPSSATIVEVRERVAYHKAASKAASKAAKNTGTAPDAPDETGAVVPVKPQKPKKVDADGDARSPGISKPLQKRLVASQMELSVDERNLDPLVLKVLKVCAGLAEPSTVPGLTKALKGLGL